MTVEESQIAHIYFQGFINQPGFQIFIGFEMPLAQPWLGWTHTWHLKNGKVYDDLELARQYVNNYVRHNRGHTQPRYRFVTYLDKVYPWHTRPVIGVREHELYGSNGMLRQWHCTRWTKTDLLCSPATAMLVAAMNRWEAIQSAAEQWGCSPDDVSAQPYTPKEPEQGVK